MLSPCRLLLPQGSLCGTFFIGTASLHFPFRDITVRTQKGRHLRKYFLNFFLNWGRYSLSVRTLYFISHSYSLRLHPWTKYFPLSHSSELNSHPIRWNFIFYATKGQWLALQGLTKDLMACVVFSPEYSNSIIWSLEIWGGNLMGWNQGVPQDAIPLLKEGTLELEASWHLGDQHITDW